MNATLKFRRTEPRLMVYIQKGKTTDQWLADWKRWDVAEGRKLKVRDAALNLYYRLNPAEDPDGYQR
jgi:hypothetical protein